eukprot:6256-Heterococcus_DN1.PRE.7
MLVTFAARLADVIDRLYLVTTSRAPLRVQLVDDVASSSSLQSSLYMQCTDFAAVRTYTATFKNYCECAARQIADALRIKLQQVWLQHLATGAAAGGIAAAATAAHYCVISNSTSSSVDAVLLIGRIAWLLLGKRGTTLKQSLQPPATATTTSGTQGCVGMDQLEAAFEIADTDGDGVLDTSEIQEALQLLVERCMLTRHFVYSMFAQHRSNGFSTKRTDIVLLFTTAVLCEAAVTFGSESQARYEGHTTLTFDEFTLLATPLLEQQDPRTHLTSGLQSVMASSASLWAQYAAAKPTHTLTQAAAALSRDCSAAAAARTDAAHWRVTHGMWCNHALTLDATDDYTTATPTDTNDIAANSRNSVISETITLPAAPWPPLQRYLLQLALQVAAVTCSADFATHAQLSATSAQKPLSRHGSTQLTHTSSFTTTVSASDSSSATVTVNSVNTAPPDFYTAAGDALCALAASHIAAVYRGLADGNGAPLQRSPEPARLQALLDVMLLQQLPGLRFASGRSNGSSSGLLGLGSSGSNRSSFQGVADVIGELIDPIDLQTYTPFLEATAKASAEYTISSVLRLISRAVSQLQPTYRMQYLHNSLCAVLVGIAAVRVITFSLIVVLRIACISAMRLQVLTVSHSASPCLCVLCHSSLLTTGLQCATSKCIQRQNWLCAATKLQHEAADKRQQLI